MFRLLTMLCFICLPAAALRANAISLSHESTAWIEDEEGWKSHRVFGLCVTPRDTVLAFNEVRLREGSDTDPHHLVLKRSTDRGRTWGPNFFIERADRGEAWANPVPVVDRQTGRIFLFYALNTKNRAAQVYYRTSDDDGVTWSERTAISFGDDPLQRPFHLPGPGHGIQTRSNALVVPVWHRYPIKDEANKVRPKGERGYSVSLLISKDGGKSWINSDYLPDEYGANESRVVELRDGRLMLNARSIHGDARKGEPTRIVATMLPDTRKWAEIRVDPAMRPFTKCDAGFLRATFLGEKQGKELLLFSRPDHPQARHQTTISISDDGGASWHGDTLVHAKSGYSDLCEFADGSFGLIYAQAGPKPEDSGPVRFVHFKVTPSR